MDRFHLVYKLMTTCFDSRGTIFKSLPLPGGRQELVAMGLVIKQQPGRGKDLKMVPLESKHVVMNF